ncbi:Cu/Ag efflux protein CusF [Nitrobacteraceae bacterium AZCC 2161]
MKITASISAFAILSAVALTTAATAQPAQEGSIANIDEPKGTITILLAPSGTVGANGANGANSTQDFRLQDGLLFNALRYGDKVTFTTAIVNGAKTITSLKKE